jgi:hypothetical protein
MDTSAFFSKQEKEIAIPAGDQEHVPTNGLFSSDPLVERS